MLNNIKKLFSSKKNCVTFVLALLLTVTVAVPAYSYFSNRAESKVNPFNLVRKWNYTIAFDGNGATSGSMTPITNVKTNQMVKLTKNTFARTGYTFTGWSLSDTGDKVHNDEATVSNLTSNEGVTVTLYAVWEPIQYTVHFNANGGTGEMADQYFAYDEEKSLSENMFFKLNCNFLGWSTSYSDEVPEYFDKQPVSNILYPENIGVDDEVTLYAVWDSANALREGYYRIIVVAEAGNESTYSHEDVDNPNDKIEKTFDGDNGSYFEGIFYVSQGTKIDLYPLDEEGELGARYICYTKEDPTQIDGMVLIEDKSTNVDSSASTMSIK